MPNPTINFRLSPYQIARGLWIVRKLAPEYTPTSASQIVKMIYLDYLAKMSYGRTDIVPADLVEEVKSMISSPRSKELSLDDVLAQQPFHRSEPAPKSETDSEISTVTDFSPPTDWLTEDD